MSELVALDSDSAAPRRDVADGFVAEEAVYYGLAQSTWVKIGILAVLFATVFWPNLRRLWEKTNPFYGEPNWGHAICVPFIGLYYLYVNREALLSAEVKASWSGLLVLAGGLLIFGYGIWPGQNDFVKDFGMVVTLFGVSLLLTGWSVMKIAWFPIAFLVCGIPWPGLVYSWVAGPLQQLAATVAVNVLELTGVKAYAAGTKIFIYGHDNALRTLNVAEACAGLRSLMTFISVAAAVAFLSARPLWQKLIIVLSAIPIAISCNVARVAGQGLLDHYVSQELSENFAHQFVGLIMLIPAFLLILAVGWVLDQIIVEETEEKKETQPVVLRRAQPATVLPAPPPPVRAAPAPAVAATAAKSAGRSFSPRGLPPGVPAAAAPISGSKRPTEDGMSIAATYRQPAFIAAVLALLVAAVGLNGAVAEMQLHFKKQPVPLARDLGKIPAMLGPWFQVSRDTGLDHDVQEVLGTDLYIFRDYINLNSEDGHCVAELIAALHPHEDSQSLTALESDYLSRSPDDRMKMLLAELNDKTNDQRRQALAIVQHSYPDAVINMAVTYYTGLVDTVAHIPDRCYIADGYEPTAYDVPTWTLADGRQLAVRFINFEDSNGAARVDKSVAYFFHVNGHFESDPLGVRRSLENLFEKYGYYAKVELMTMDPDHSRSAQTMTSFLSSALSEVQKCLPDWNAVTHQSVK